MNTIEHKMFSQHKALVKPLTCFHQVPYRMVIYRSQMSAALISAAMFNQLW